MQVIVLNRIRTKLFLLILFMSIGGLGVTALMVNYQVDFHFNEYVQDEQARELQGMKELLESNYQNNLDWSGSQEILKNYIHGRKVIIFLQEVDSGNVIFSNVDSPGYGRRRSTELERMKRISIYNQEGESAAFLYWELQGQNRFQGEHSNIFLDKVNHSIITVAVLMIILTIIVSLLLSRYFTRPLLKMNKLASAVEGGNYEKRLQIRGNDEISHLGNSLNIMTARLQYLEKVRKESTDDLAHELRTPLTIISGYITAMKDEVLPVDDTTLREMEDEINRLIRLVNRLNELAESEEKILNFKPQKVDFKELLQQTVSFYKKEASQRKLQLNTKIIGDKFVFRGDRDGLKSIIVNLLSNAIKFTPEGGKIDIELKREENKLFFKLKNEGVEIPEKDLPYIFSRFYRGDKSRLEESGGTGLGLTITHKLVRAHQGKITVESKNGVTVFTVVLPIN